MQHMVLLSCSFPPHAVNTCVGSLQVKSTLAAAAQRSGAQLLELVGDAAGWMVRGVAGQIGVGEEGKVEEIGRHA